MLSFCFNFIGKSSYGQPFRPAASVDVSTLAALRFLYACVLIGVILLHAVFVYAKTG